MDITPLIPEHNQIIQSYGPGSFKVNGISYTHSIIVTPDRTMKWEVPANFKDLDETHLEDLFEKIEGSSIDLLLLGTGETGHFLFPSLLKTIREHHITPETMNTGAACRTYNVLMPEGRRIACGLLVL
jgi:uncharacterized protein